jgi:hypothetical protein
MAPKNRREVEWRMGEDIKDSDLILMRAKDDDGAP